MELGEVFANALFLRFAFSVPDSTTALAATLEDRLHDGVFRLQNLEATSLDDLLDTGKSFGQQVLVWQLPVGDEPELAVGTKSLGGSSDELHTDERIGVLAFVKGRVHHDGVVLNALQSTGDIMPAWLRLHTGGNDAEVAPRTLKTVAVGVVDIE